jgi:DNA-binding response OmpR family regulator
LSAKGDELKLTDKEVEILRYLHRARGAIVSRDELLANIWGYHESVTTHTIETHIYRLRQKIETNNDEASLLITESGGYRLAETVKES